MATKRIPWIDLAKAIAIVAIIVGHFTAFFASASPAADAAFRLMDSFHVPLFFLLSGYCLKGPLDRARAARLAKRCLLPYAFCGAACLVACALLIDGVRIEQHLFGLFYGAGAYRDHILFADTADVQAIGVLWFLPSLLFGQLFASLCLRAGKLGPGLPLALSFALFLVGATTAGLLFLPWDIQQALCAAWFICCGYLLKRYEVLRRPWARRALQVTGALYMAALVGGVLEEPMYCNSTYHQPVLDGLGCVGAACLVTSLAKGLERLPQRAEAALSWVGRNTLAIFCFHAITLATGDHLKWWLLDLASSGLGVAVVLPVSLGIDLALSIGLAWAVRFVPGVRAVFGYGPPDQAALRGDGSVTPRAGRQPGR